MMVDQNERDPTFGSNGKVTDSVTGIAVLGARAYQRSEARFLSVDPIDGGCANNYTYATGDPFTTSDFTGQKCSSRQFTGSILGIAASAEALGQTGEAEILITEHAILYGWTGASIGALAGVAIIGAGFGVLAGYLIYHLATHCKK